MRPVYFEDQDLEGMNSFEHTCSNGFQDNSVFLKKIIKI